MLKTKSAIVFLASAMLAMPVAAQQADAVPLEANSEHFVFNALSQNLALPLPDWAELAGAEPDALLDRVSVSVRQDENLARVEIYPRGEGQAFWSRLYGARIFNQPDLTLASLRTAIIDVYARTCRADTIALFQLEPDDGDNIPPLGFVCGAYLDLPGYSGQGEVMIVGFYKSAQGVATVYQEWRGAAFDATDSSTWPVSAEQIEMRVDQFKSQTALVPVD